MLISNSQRVDGITLEKYPDAKDYATREARSSISAELASHVSDKREYFIRWYESVRREEGAFWVVGQPRDWVIDVQCVILLINVKDAEVGEEVHHRGMLAASSYADKIKIGDLLTVSYPQLDYIETRRIDAPINRMVGQLDNRQFKRESPIHWTRIL